MRFVPCVVLVVALSLRAQNNNLKTLDEVEQWHFNVQNGRVDVKLSSYAHAGRPLDTMLALDFTAGDSSPVSVQEQADLVGKVLQEVSSLKYEPRGLQMISAPLEGSELSDGVDIAVTSSGKWRSCIGRKYCFVAQEVADRFLKSIDAFKELDGTLQAYGIRRKKVTVDDVACAAVSQQRPANLNKSSRKVSCGGLVLIEMVPVE